MKNDLITKGDAVKAILDWMDEHKREVIHKQDITDVIMPLSEDIIRCKDCKWWDTTEAMPFGYCLAAKHGYYSRHWEINIRRTYDANFYCADAERKENG